VTNKPKYGRICGAVVENVTMS